MDTPQTAPDGASSSQSQQAMGPPNAFMAMAGHAKMVALNVLKERKPWVEMVDRNSFSRPTSLAEAGSRLKKNLAYFRINYLVVLLLITVVCMALNPTSLLVLAGLAVGWMYLFVLRATPLVIGGRTISDREKFIGMSAISGVIIFFLTSVGTILFTAIGISLSAISIHGAFRQPDDLFSDEAEQQIGFLSFLKGPQPGTGQNMV